MKEMMSRRSLTVAAFFLFLFLTSAHAHAGKESSPAYRTAIEQSKAEAVSLMKAGKAKEAYELYARLLREEPEDDEIALGMARAAMHAGRPNQAVMAYLLLLEKYPHEKGLYEEIGQAYMALGDRETARIYLEQAKLENVGSTLDLLEKRYSATQVHGRLRAGLMFDSNANQGPSSNLINLGNYLVRLDNAKSISSAALYAGAQVDVAHRLDQSSPWWLVGDAQALWRGNANSDLNSMHSRESQWGRVSFGVRHLDSQTLFDLRLKGEVYDYEFYQRVMALGPEMLFLVAIRPDVHLITRAGVDRRVYSDDPVRNGLYGYTGEYVRFFVGQDNHEFLFGGRYMWGDAERGDFSYDGWEGSARFAYKASKKLEIAPSLTYTRENYKGAATVLETDSRRNRIKRAGLSVTYYLTDEWSIEGAYQYTRNSSNSSLYDYRQHVISLGAAWNF